MQWHTRVDLQFQHPIQHQIEHLIGVLRVHASEQVHTRWIIRSLAERECGAGIAAPDHALQLFHRLVKLLPFRMKTRRAHYLPPV